MEPVVQLNGAGLLWPSMFGVIRHCRCSDACLSML